MTYNQDFFDSMVRHQVGVQQFAGGVRNRIWALLDETERDLKDQIRNAGRIGLDTSPRIRRMNRLLAQLRETRLLGWEQATSQWIDEMKGFALAEPGFVERVFVNTFPGVDLGLVAPNPADLRNMVRSKPFQGRTLAEWARRMARDDVDRIERQIKIGLVQGEDPRQLSRRIVGRAALNGRGGMTQITRNHAATLARTVTNGIGAEARREFALVNQHIAPNELFVATLDARTTPICRRYDGKRYAVGTGPILPLHFNERSIRILIASAEAIGNRPRRDFTERQLLREYADDLGLKRVPLRRADLPTGTKGGFDQFARKRMRKLTGTTPATTTYGPWLQSQSAAVQDDILGKFRGQLFRNGDLKIEKFVDTSGRVFTLEELANRHTDAFIRAGLDLKRFAA